MSKPHIIRASYLVDAPSAQTAPEVAACAPSHIVWIPVGESVISALGGNDGEGFSGRVLCDETAYQMIAASFAELSGEGYRFWIDDNHDNGASFGWVQAFEWDAARGIIAVVDWNADGHHAITQKKFRSFSPAFLIDPQTSRPFSLIPGEAAGALVNAPAFGRRMPDLVFARSKTLAAKVAARSNPNPHAHMSAPATEAAPAAVPTAPAPVKAADASDVNTRLEKIEAMLSSLVEHEKEDKKVEASSAPAATVLPAVKASAPVETKLGLVEALKAYAAARSRGAMDAGRVYASELHRRIGSEFSGIELQRVMAANSLGTLAGTLVAQRALVLLKLRLPILTRISTDFSDLNAAFNQSISTRTRAIPTAVEFDPANGYPVQNAGTTDVQVTINKNIGVPIAFSVNELASTTRDLFGEQVEGSIYAIARHMSDAINALITNANFSNSTTKAAASFTRATVNEMAAALFDRGVPEFGRTLALNATYFEKLLSDSAIVSLAAFQKPQVIEEFALPRVGGFEVLLSPTIPANGENLTGYGFTPDALVIATRVPNDYTQALGGANNGAVSVVTDPDTGISMQLAQWVNHDLARTTSRLVLMYGVAMGQVASLQRLKSA